MLVTMEYDTETKEISEKDEIKMFNLIVNIVF